MTLSSTGYVDGAECVLTPALIETAIAQAAAAVKVTRKTSLHDRAQVLERVATALFGDSESVARNLSAESGYLSLNDMRLEVLRAVEVFRLAGAYALTGTTQALDADVVERSRGVFGIIRREPIGAVLGITAFNGPLLIPSHKIAPAVVAGTSIVIKPSPRVPKAALDIARRVVEAGWPKEAIAVLDVDDEQTMALVKDERIPVISFTGGSVGWKIKEAAPRKHVQLEMGGVGAVLIAADANLAQAANECAAGAFVRSGQSCISVQRIYVDQSVHDDFICLLAKEVKSLAAASPIGAMVDDTAADRIEQIVLEALEAGATLVYGGQRCETYLEPTIVSGATGSMKIMRQELFGPVVAVATYRSIQDAIAEINAVSGAIHHGVYTSNLDLAFQAADAIHAGGIIINGPCTWRVDHMPYGGVGSSGFGREGIAWSVREYTQPKVIIVRGCPAD